MVVLESDLRKVIEYIRVEAEESDEPLFREGATFVINAILSSLEED